MAELLIEKFNALKERQGKPDIRTMPKVMKRLQKEVVKAKDVLSANKNVVLKIGELVDYVTLQTTIERKEFEEKAADFFSKVTVPVEEALKIAGLTIEQIDQVELLGGGIRVPKV